MSYAALMIYVDNDAMPEQRVRLAANLADRFTASLIGLAALAVPPPVVADGMVMDALTDADIQLMKAKLAEKGEWFRAIAGGDRRQGEWRSVLDLPTDALAREARSADLVVIGRTKRPGSPYTSLDPGEAILKMGRPTLVPEGVATLRAEHVVIGWKDTREARRAVLELAPVPASGDARRGSRVMLAQKGSGAAQLIRVAQEERADLLVAGAYGHSRLGELIFGGMTRDLLSTSPICCLMSH